MNIKEVEALLHVSRSNIRFYEKEGLLRPERRDNNYRDYSTEDAETLRKILVLRKLGFSLEEIAGIQKGALSLTDAAAENIQRLEREMEALSGALRVTQSICRSNSGYDTMDAAALWESITDAEQAGQQFADICRDYLLFELDLFDSMWKRVFGINFKVIRAKNTFPAACLILLLICVIRGLSRWLLWKESFWEGFFYPFVIFAIGSAILLPVYILRKKAPKTAKVVSTVLSVLGIGLVVLCVGLLIYGLVRGIFCS